ncbi:MAG: hypothetical protein WCP16_17860 [Pseudanabaena sp. ELA645]
MKILHVIPSIAKVRGGLSVAVVQMVKSLRNTGVDAEIVTTNDNERMELDLQLRILHKYEDVPVRFFSKFSPFVHAVSEFDFSIDLTAWLWYHIHDYDLIHIHGGLLGIVESVK